MASQPACEHCTQEGGAVVYRDGKLRVVLVEDASYPGFCRVIWNGHVKEMTDLADADRAALMHAVWQTEAALREIMQPEKINLASLGNMTPHVHWHVIPRFADDAHFPHPVWAQVQRAGAPAQLDRRASLLPLLRRAIAAKMDAGP